MRCDHVIQTRQPGFNFQGAYPTNSCIYTKIHEIKIKAFCRIRSETVTTCFNDKLGIPTPPPLLWERVGPGDYKGLVGPWAPSFTVHHPHPHVMHDKPLHKPGTEKFSHLVHFFLSPWMEACLKCRL